VVARPARSILPMRRPAWLDDLSVRPAFPVHPADFELPEA
jgi:hypothetical protein